MSKLKELLEGVEVGWKPLARNDNAVAELCRGRVMSKSFLEENIGVYPVYSSQTANNGEIGNINTFDFDGEAVTWTTDGANAGTVFHRTGKFSITNVCGLIKILETSKLNYRFLFYWLSIEAKKYVYSGMGNPKLMSHQMEKIQIPIPCPENPTKSLEIQKEIVRILDTFTERTDTLINELTTELEDRKKQYNYYREKLLSFKDCLNNCLNQDLQDSQNFQDKVVWKMLGEESVGKFIRGGGLQKKDFTKSGIGCIHYGQIYTHYGTFAIRTKTFISEEFAKKARMAKYGDLVIATTSENDEDVCKAVAWLGKEEIAVSSDACFYTHSLNPKYVAYFFQTEQFQKQKRPFITGTKVRRVNADDLAKIKIPVPSPEEQERIVAILDKLESLTASISEALPNEIALRKMQYEYYRDLLLTFPKDNIKA